MLAERHRAAMGEYFHCTLSMHVLMARMYVTDHEFSESYERIEAGLAEWMKRVIDANARANGIDPATAEWQYPPPPQASFCAPRLQALVRVLSQPRWCGWLSSRSLPQPVPSPWLLGDFPFPDQLACGRVDGDVLANV